MNERTTRSKPAVRTDQPPADSRQVSPQSATEAVARVEHAERLVRSLIDDEAQTVVEDQDERRPVAPDSPAGIVPGDAAVRTPVEAAGAGRRAERSQSRHAAADDSLAALVDTYALDADLPPAEWLTRLKLERPRRDIRSLSPFTRFMKRLMDVVVASTLLVVCAPIMLLVAIAVKLTSPGPVIFRQTRVGLNLRDLSHRDRRRRRLPPPDGIERRRQADRRQQFAYGKPFTLYKFRTMRVDAEKDGARFAVKNDPRLTPIGGFLRRTRLDELPQLWNVLKGEMSMVGPRPERPEFIEKLSAEIPNYLQRLGLKPGLTGLAQILNGYDNDIEGFRRKVALDLLYLQNCCLRNDLKILLRTVFVVLTGKGAL